MLVCFKAEDTAFANPIVVDYVDQLEDGYYYLNDTHDKTMIKAIVANGAFQGEVRVYYYSGKLMSKFCCINKKLAGEYIVYDENGGVKERRFYKNGIEITDIPNIIKNIKDLNEF